MSEENKEKMCFQFQPIAIPVKTLIAGAQQPSINLQFVGCLKEQCMAWDPLKKDCRILKN